jgi:hypothetical protein
LVDHRRSAINLFIQNTAARGFRFTAADPAGARLGQVPPRWWAVHHFSTANPVTSTPQSPGHGSGSVLWLTYWRFWESLRSCSRCWA